MKEKVGKVFSITKDNQPVPGCTISKSVTNGDVDIMYFSLAKGTDISAEMYPYHKLLIIDSGKLDVYGEYGTIQNLAAGDAMLTPTDTPVGMKTDESTVYTDVTVRRDDIMNEAIKAGEAFKLAELIPYQDDRIINMDVVHNDKMKFVVMAFAEGTGLSEHAAPGEALIFALDGEAIIGYEGKEHRIKAGETFRFAKGGLHYVTADHRFKMALLLTLE